MSIENRAGRASFRIGRLGRRLTVVVAAAMALTLLLASPADADPARPTNFRSRVSGVVPSAPPVSIKVVGGDGFLDLDVIEGHTVVVTGYRGEPYLRVLPDGSVQENTNSPATYLNRDRYARSKVPPTLIGQERLPPPAWQTIGRGGHAVWHDHRIHFMGQDTGVIGGLDEGRPVPWTVGLTVDGTDTQVSGNYRLLDPPSPWPWAALALVLIVAMIVVGRREDRAVLIAAAATTVAGLVGLIVGWQQNAAIPAGAGATPLTVILPVIVVIAGIVGLVRFKSPSAVIAVLAGVAAAGGWVITRSSVLWKAVLPTDLAPGLDRAGTAMVIGLAVGAAIVVIRSGALSPSATE